MKTGNLIIFLTVFFILIVVFSLLGINGIPMKYTDKKGWMLMKSIDRGDNSKEKNRCRDLLKCLTAISKPSDVMLMGDSNAYHFSESIHRLSIENKFNFINMTFPGCLPLAKFHRLDEPEKYNIKCIDRNQKMIKLFTTKNFEGTIILSAAWLFYLHGEDYYRVHTNKNYLPPASTVILSQNGVDPLIDINKAFFKYIDETLSLLSKHSRRLLVVGPMPPGLMNFNLKKHLLKNNHPSSRALFKTYAIETDAKLIELSKRYNAQYISMEDILCEGNICNTGNSDGHFYGDITHLSDYGQKYLIYPTLKNILTTN